MEHAGNSSVVNCFVRIHMVGIILFDQIIDFRELAQAVADITIGIVNTDRAGGPLESSTEQAAQGNNKKNREERVTRTSTHKKPSPKPKLPMSAEMEPVHRQQFQ